MNSNSNWAFQEFQFQLKIMSQKLIIDFENSNSTRATNNYLLIPRFPIPTSNGSKVNRENRFTSQQHKQTNPKNTYMIWPISVGTQFRHFIRYGPLVSELTSDTDIFVGRKCVCLNVQIQKHDFQKIILLVNNKVKNAIISLELQK